MDLGQLIKQLAKEDAEVIIRLAKVTKVNGDRTCTVDLVQDDTEVKEVLLQSVKGKESGVYITPVVGSYVMVVINELPFVCLTTEFESLELGGKDNGGLTITPELKKQLEKTNKLLDAILNVITGAPIVEAGNGAPSSLQQALNIAVAGKQLGSYNNIENEKVVH